MSAPEVEAGMEDFKKQYVDLYKKLKIFLKKLPSRLDKDYPKKLKNVQVISRILRPKDKAFRKYDAQAIALKFFIVKEMTVFILDHVGVFVSVKYQGWFQKKGDELKHLILIQLMATASIQADQSMESLPSGVGGINFSEEKTAMTMKPKLLKKVIKLRDKLTELDACPPEAH